MAAARSHHAALLCGLSMESAMLSLLSIVAGVLLPYLPQTC